MLNCTNRQILKFVSAYKTVTARLVEEGIFLGIVETPYWFQVLPIAGLGIFVLGATDYFLDFSMLGILIASSIFLLFLSSPLKYFLARLERQKFKGINLMLVEEQEQLEKMRRQTLAELTGKNNN